MTLRSFFRVDDEHPFTGWHMLAVVGLFFGTIIAVNGVLAVAATGTFPGLVVENSYVASQHYNAVLADDRARNEAGWRTKLDAPAGILDFRLANRDGVAVRRLAVTAFVGRPSSTRDDRTLALSERTDGYRAAEALPTGLWEIDVEARRDGDLVYRARKRLYVPPPGAGND